MKTISLRLDDKIHREAKRSAKKELRSLNSWMTVAIQEKLDRPKKEKKR